MSPPDVVDIEVVEDRTERARCDEGFLRLRRLLVRNRYEDGSTSAPYPCDVVSRERTDAVAVVIYAVDARRQVRVALRTGVRPPVTLRREKALTQPDDRTWLLLTEIVAGLIEPQDQGPAGLGRRAAAECLEEAGYEVEPEATAALGAPMFASPGMGDEKVYYRAVETDLGARGEPAGDGSIMEEAGEVVLLELAEAIAMCRRGDIPDSKTEIGLLRLCDHIGYLPQLGRFVDELPEGCRPPPGRMEALRGRTPDE